MDTKTFDLLYYKYSQPMLLYTLTYVNSKSDAEDIVQIVKAVFYKRAKYQDVADHLGISINTVKTLLRRAISQLRECHAGNFNLFLYFLLK